MSNFEYIISSLPYLTMDFKYAGQAGFNSVISDISSGTWTRRTRASWNSC